MKQTCFLNFAATAPIKLATASYMSKLCQEMSEPLGAHFYAWLGLIEQTRRRLAELIGAFPIEIAFFNNTSTALSVLALGLPLVPGDIILAPEDEFSSNRFVWQNLAQKGIRFRSFTVEKDKSLAETLNELDLKGVKLISISAVSYCSGRVYELKAFADFCKAHGIWSCVDAIQAVGATPLNCHELGIDFLAGGGQKWLLGPIGCGYLFARQEWLQSLFVPFVGWTSSKYPERHQIQYLEFCEELARFEPGLPNFLPIAGLGHSLNTLEKTGWSFIFEEIQKRSRYLKSNLDSLGYELLTPLQAPCAGIISVKIPHDILPRLVLEHFEKHRIQLTVRDFLRVSPHFDTPWSQLDVFLNAAASLRQLKAPVWSLSWQPPSPKPEKQPFKSAWILGATGSLGQALTHQLAADGYHLHLIARNKIELDLLASSLTASCQVHQVNLAHFSEVQELCRQLNEPVDLLIIACCGNTSARFNEVNASMFEQMGLLPGIGAVLGAFEKQASSKARVIGLSALFTKFHVPYLSYYHALHAGLEHLLHAFEVESGIKSQLVYMEACHSKLQKRIGRTLLRYFRPKGSFNYKHPEEIAYAIVKAIKKNKPLKLSLKIRIQQFVINRFPSFYKRWLQRLKTE